MTLGQRLGHGGQNMSSICLYIDHFSFAYTFAKLFRDCVFVADFLENRDAILIGGKRNE